MTALWLGSDEVTGWSGAREVRLLELAAQRGSHRAYWAVVDPPGPRGLRHVVMTPRYRGDTLNPVAGSSVVVDLWIPGRGEAPGQTVDIEALERGGQGELYTSHDAAAATTGGW